MASIQEQLAAINKTLGPKSGGPIMFFGKYKGRHISEVPESYLAYLTKQYIDNSDIKEMVYDELERRGLDIC